MHGESPGHQQRHQPAAVKVRKDKSEPTEVLIAFQNVVNRGSKHHENSAPYVHRALIREGTAATPASTAP